MYYLGKYQDIQSNEKNNVNFRQLNTQWKTKYKNDKTLIKEEKIVNQNVLKLN